MSNISEPHAAICAGNVVPLWKLIWSSVSTVICVFVILSNVVILVVTLHQKVSLRMPLPFVKSAAVGDILMAISFIFFNLVHSTRWQCHVLMCFFAYGLLFFFIGISTINIFLISLERFVAIKYAIYYNLICTQRFQRYLLATVWILVFGYTFVQYSLAFNFQKFRKCDSVVIVSKRNLVTGVIYLIVLQIASSITYLYIFLISWSHWKRLYQMRREHRRTCREKIHGPHCSFSRQGTELGRAFDNSVRIVSPADRRRRSPPRMTYRAHVWRFTKAMGIVLITFYAFWSPLWLLQVLRLIYSQSGALRILSFCTQSFSAFNSCLNLFIYAWQVKDFREALKSLLRIKLR